MKHKKSEVSRLVRIGRTKSRDGGRRARRGSPQTVKQALVWLAEKIEKEGWHPLSHSIGGVASYLNAKLAFDTCARIRREIGSSLIVWEGEPNRTKADVLNLLRRLS